MDELTVAEGAGLTHSNLVVSNPEAEPKMMTPWQGLVKQHALEVVDEEEFLNWLQGDGYPVENLDGGDLDSLYTRFIASK